MLTIYLSLIRKNKKNTSAYIFLHDFCPPELSCPLMLKPTNEPEGLANSKSSCTPKVPSVALSCKAAKFLDIAALSLLEAIAPSYPRFVGELLRKTNFFVYSFIDLPFFLLGLKVDGSKFLEFNCSCSCKLCKCFLVHLLSGTMRLRQRI